MSITYGDHLIDSGHYDPTPEREREIEASRCATCSGHGEIGWFDHAEGAWRNEPCPDCQGNRAALHPTQQPPHAGDGQ